MPSKSMTREELEEYLFEFIEEELPQELMQQIEVSLSQFPELQEEVVQQRKLRSQLSNLQPEIPTGLEGDILHYVREGEATQTEHIQFANNNNAFLGWLPSAVVVAAIGLFFILPTNDSKLEVEQAGVITSDVAVEHEIDKQATTQPLEEVNLNGNRMIVVMGEQQIQDLQAPSHIQYQPTSALFLHEIDTFLQSYSGKWTSTSGKSQPFELNEQYHSIEILIPSQHMTEFNHFMTKHGYHWSPMAKKGTINMQKIAIELRYRD